MLMSERNRFTHFQFRVLIHDSPVLDSCGSQQDEIPLDEVIRVSQLPVPLLQS